MRGIIRLVMVSVLCAACLPVGWTCSSSWSGSSCQICRAFADALIYHTDRGTVSHGNVVNRCNSELGRTYGNCDFDNHCSSYYTNHYSRMSEDLEDDPGADADDLCQSDCSTVSLIQLATGVDAEIQRKKIFRSLLSEMRVFTTSAQKDCNMCKNLAHAVFVSPDQLNIDIEGNPLFTRCLTEFSDQDKPVWHQKCRCKTLIYDLFISRLTKPERSSTNEEICEYIGRCSSCERSSNNILEMLKKKRARIDE